MTTTNEAVDAIVKHLGFPAPRVRAVARRLTEAGILPSGAPKKSPICDMYCFLDLLIGSALDVPLRAVADEVRAYRALTPAGVPLSVINQTVSGHLGWLAWEVVKDTAFLTALQIEIVSNWREIAFHDLDGIQRWREPGALASHWGAVGYRNAVTINGGALAAAVCELFQERN